MLILPWPRRIRLRFWEKWIHDRLVRIYHFHTTFPLLHGWCSCQTVSSYDCYGKCFAVSASEMIDSLLTLIITTETSSSSFYHHGTYRNSFRSFCHQRLDNVVWKKLKKKNTVKITKFLKLKTKHWENTRTTKIILSFSLWLLPSSSFYKINNFLSASQVLFVVLVVVNDTRSTPYLLPRMEEKLCVSAQSKCQNVFVGLL